MTTAREEVRRLLKALPEDASFEDLQYSIYVREWIERGRKEADESKVVEQAEVVWRKSDRK